MYLRLLPVLAIGWCLACGRTETQPVQTAKSLCQPLCGYAARCNLAGSCLNECDAKGLTDDRASHWKRDFVAAVDDCLAALDCSANDSTCFERALAQVEPDYQKAPDVGRCLQKRTDCHNAWADDLCYSLAALEANDRAASDACSSTADCPGFKACMAPYGAFYY
jgi:hypothetical protein